MMWVGSPAYFGVVLLKAIWFGGIPAGPTSNEWSVPPTVLVAAQIEPSMKQCALDGKAWEKDATVEALKGTAPINNGVWKCVIVATGGLST